jgi:NAD(P)-dependent dehydrogenase (short-subunit alcohol dehydrogenase family)
MILHSFFSLLLVLYKITPVVLTIFTLPAVIEGTQFALNQMRVQSPPGGVIVNVASMAGYLPSVEFPVYTAAKHGVVGFTKSLGKRLVKTMGVRVVGIAPSYAETPLLQAGKQDEGRVKILI